MLVEILVNEFSVDVGNPNSVDVKEDLIHFSIPTQMLTFSLMTMKILTEDRNVPLFPQIQKIIGGIIKKSKSSLINSLNERTIKAIEIAVELQIATANDTQTAVLTTKVTTAKSQV